MIRKLKSRIRKLKPQVRKLKGTDSETKIWKLRDADSGIKLTPYMLGAKNTPVAIYLFIFSFTYLLNSVRCIRIQMI